MRRKVKEVVIGEPKDYKRMNLVAESTGIAVSSIKALILAGKLTRYKLGAITLIDMNEFEKLIVRGVANNGPERAPESMRTVRGSRP